MRNLEYQQAQGIALVKGEEVLAVLQSKAGLLSRIPVEPGYLVITDQRVIASWEDENKQRRLAMPRDHVDAVEVAEQEKDSKPLLTGGLFMMAGLFVPWVAVLLNFNGVISWLLAIVMVLLGAVTASSYFSREYLAVVTFKAGDAELWLPLSTREAIYGAYHLVNVFFAPDASLEPAQREAYENNVPDLGALYATNQRHREIIRWSRDDAQERREYAAPLSPAPSELVDSSQLQGRHDV